MAKQLFSNNASALLAANIDDVETSVQVAAGLGALFPNPTGGDYFMIAVENADGDIEFMRCTARATDILTVVRGQEGSAAMAFTNGQARVENRLTADTLELFLQRTGDFMEGDLDMDGHDIIDAHLTGTSTKILAGEIVGVPLRGAEGDASNELVVPAAGARPTIGGVEILLDGDDLTEFVDFTGFAELDVQQSWTKSQATTPATLTVSGSTVAVNLANSNKFRLSLTANATLSNPTNAIAGIDFSIIVVPNALGRTLGFGSKYTHPNDVAPDLSGVPSGDAVILTFSWDSTTDRYLVTMVGPFDLA